MTSKCEMCGTELKEFTGYIPNKGECCLKCWRNYMIADDSNKSVLPKPSRPS